MREIYELIRNGDWDCSSWIFAGMTSHKPDLQAIIFMGRIYTVVWDVHISSDSNFCGMVSGIIVTYEESPKQESDNCEYPIEDCTSPYRWFLEFSSIFFIKKIIDKKNYWKNHKRYPRYTNPKELKNSNKSKKQ